MLYRFETDVIELFIERQWSKKCFVNVLCLMKQFRLSHYVHFIMKLYLYYLVKLIKMHIITQCFNCRKTQWSQAGNVLLASTKLTHQKSMIRHSIERVSTAPDSSGYVPLVTFTYHAPQHSVTPHCNLTWYTTS